MDEKGDSHFENKPAESEQLSRINQQLQATNQQLAASEQQLRAANQQLGAANQQLKVEEQQLRAASQQLKAANQHLRESEEKFRSMFELSPFSKVLLDLEGNVLECNQQFVKFHATKEGPEAQVGRNISEFFPPEQRPLLFSTIERTIKEKKTIIGPVEYIMSREDGSTFPAEGFSIVMLDSAGSPEALLGLANDITERKQAEEKLRDSRNMLQTVLDSIPAAVFWKDRDSIYLGCNRTFLGAVGLKSSEEVVGKSDYDLPWKRKQADSFREYDRRIMESGIPEYDIIEPYLRADGTHAWAKTNKVPLRDTEGNVVGILGTYEDITERKRAEQELQKAHDELEKRVEERTAQLLKANRQLESEIAERKRKEEMLHESEKIAAVGRLAARIAHEINNPLAGIKNSFLLIKDSIPDSHPYYKYVGLIEKEILRVSDIVRRMYDLYRPVQAQQRDFHLREAVADVVALLKVASEEHKVNISIDIDDGIVVRLPDGLLRQVLFNIIQNAIEASHSHSIVKVTAGICEDVLSMKVIDSGTGIAEDIREKIFEPFFTSKRDDAERGLGLGLSVCKNIVDAIGGEVIVQSRVGKGTTFTINIPLKNKNAESENG